MMPLSIRAINPLNPTLKVNPADRLRLFCFPYAGGGISSFRGWRDGISSDIGFYPIELPGRGFRIGEPLAFDLQLLVGEIARSLYLYLDKPFAFFGHSLGALLSFELARFLRKEYDLQPIALFVSGRNAPHLSPHNLTIHKLKTPEFIEKIRGFNGTPEEVFKNPELLAMILPILRADFAMLETYWYREEAPLQCPIAVFGGLQDSETKIEFLEAWQLQTTHSISLHLFSGDHFFIQRWKKDLLQLIERQLKEL